ncbi:ABC transporter-like [Richelia intracellularis HH01]|jgi:multiple sugar transport system ATP-binding protein|uniref:ABC transporter-like n=1 Tax=Richelia intracellularis HH01 TaxID=1165094 RepID=M1WTH4_9NOST|nr:ABC transporter ATP-binding protein [Richelia intracellularis]CCH68109.1 ABC transporter-like [Richelia intracellularis HH01]
MARVILQNVKHVFNNVVAITDISLDIPDGEFWVLVGPSGCGKSTILRTIAGLETTNFGKIYIGDKLMNDIPARKRDVSMVFQNYALYPHMTVRQNLAFGLRMRGVKHHLIQERIAIVAQSLVLEGLLERKPKQLSGGQQQRVALGRAIARQPKVFLLDEPLSNLDTKLRDNTRHELKELHRSIGITTIYVTHSQVEAMTLADKIVVLQGGKIQQVGTPQTIYNQPANRIVATFIGNPPMNILHGTYTGEGFNVAGNFLPIISEIQQKLNFNPGQTIDLGIRPEHLTLNYEDNDPSLLGEVKVVETLGRETFVRLGLTGSNIIINAIITANRNINPGDLLRLGVDLSKLFLFDPHTEERIFPIL